MPPETDRDILALLLRLLRDRQFNLTSFKRTADTGGNRPDEGLCNLLPGDATIELKRQRLKDALIEFLEHDGRPNRTEERGDPQLGWQPGIFHEFRVRVDNVGLFVKARIIESDSKKIPRLVVVGVKRADSVKE